jgi:hypothetical protein
MQFSYEHNLSASRNDAGALKQSKGSLIGRGLRRQEGRRDRITG